MKIYAYNNGSASAKALSNALNIKRIKHDGKNLNVDTLINWGASVIKRPITAKHVLNFSEAVKIASNKLLTFTCLQDFDIPTPEWTQSADKALEWFDQGVTVVVRNKLTGHSGEGIVICEPGGDELKDHLDAPLYTKYIPKKEEYRVHVFVGKIIHIQRKARKKDIPDDQINWKIRNHGNGFIFAHQDVDLPDEAKKIAIDAVKATNLHFGAVDMIWNSQKNKYYVLEINTAPGLEGTTLDRYVEAIKEVNL